MPSPLNFSCDAVNRFLGFVVNVLGVIEAQYYLLLVSFSRNCSAAVPYFKVRFPLLTSFVNLHFSVLLGVYACFH